MAKQYKCLGKGTSTLDTGHPRSLVSALEILLSAGADVNASGGEYGSALEAAACWRDLDTAKWLSAHGADVESRGSTGARGKRRGRERTLGGAVLPLESLREVKQSWCPTPRKRWEPKVAADK